MGTSGLPPEFAHAVLPSYAPFAAAAGVRSSPFNTAASEDALDRSAAAAPAAFIAAAAVAARAAHIDSYARNRALMAVASVSALRFPLLSSSCRFLRTLAARFFVSVKRSVDRRRFFYPLLHSAAKCSSKILAKDGERWAAMHTASNLFRTVCPLEDRWLEGTKTAPLSED